MPATKKRKTRSLKTWVLGIPLVSILGGAWTLGGWAVGKWTDMDARTAANASDNLVIHAQIGDVRLAVKDVQDTVHATAARVDTMNERQDRLYEMMLPSSRMRRPP